MAFPASAVLDQAAVIIQDEGGQRWPASELLKWLNAGLREAFIHKPTAFTQTRVLTLVQGTKQTLDAGQSDMVRAIRNVTATGQDITDAGRAITVTDRETMDQIALDWHDPALVPQSGMVMHVMADSADPGTYYVFPGNDGNGQIEAIVTQEHAELAAPADPGAIVNFTASVDLDSYMQNPLVDYVCYRAFSKDMLLNGAGNRAATHMQAFLQSLGVRQQAEFIGNVNTTGQEPRGRA